jgi:lysophospholipid acyltransferase (LPLAT)-like uncharacterized protein
MKLMKRETLKNLVEAAGPPLIRLLGSTWRVRLLPEGIDEERRRRGETGIFTFWHGRMLIPAYSHRFKKFAVLISRHHDGEFIARTVARLGFIPIRGSSTRGGARAMMVALKQVAVGHDVVFTPDGPRGPRYKVQRGVIFAASRTGIPITPCAVEAWPNWTLGSWDEFTIPKPFARAVVVQGEPIPIPPDLEGEAMDPYCLQVERAMVKMMEEARAMVRETW